MPSPLLGYNTNVRHRGKIFHIQTEDSGITHAHIFTHLFADGGRIIATKKTTYAQYVGSDRFPGVVKKLMQAQHKAMFIALRDGLFDEDEVAGAKAFNERQIVLEEDATQPTTVPTPAGGAAARGAEVDVDALERAAAAFSGGYTPPQPAAPPAPVVPRPAPVAAPRPTSQAAQAPLASSSPPQAQRVPTPATPASRPLYQATQPASVRPRAPKQADSLFGADILSEKSLDEVIMSYLAEDLDEKE